MPRGPRRTSSARPASSREADPGKALEKLLKDVAKGGPALPSDAGTLSKTIAKRTYCLTDSDLTGLSMTEGRGYGGASSFNYSCKELREKAEAKHGGASGFLAKRAKREERSRKNEIAEATALAKAAGASAPAAAPAAAPKKRKATTPATKTKAKKSTAAATSTAAKDEWFVEVSRRGCHGGDERLDDSYGPFATEKAAQAKAVAERDYLPDFEDWSVEFYGDAKAPFDSADGENCDEDEWVHVLVTSSAIKAAANAKESARAAKEIAKFAAPAAAAAAAAAAAPPLAPPPAGDGVVGVDRSLTAKCVPDKGYFARTPLDKSMFPSAPGAAPSRFPAGYVYNIERISTACYTAVAFGANPSLGARFAVKKFPRTYGKTVVWFPPAEHARGGRYAPPAASVVDCVHTDFCAPNCGSYSLTSDEILGAVSESTTVLILNYAKDPAVLAAAIRKCGALTAVCLVESNISPDVLAALAEKAATLRTLHMNQCGADDDGSDDAAWAAFLGKATQLVWLRVEFYSIRSGQSFGELAFEAVPASVLVFWFGCGWSSGAAVSGWPAFLEKYGPAIAEAQRRLPNAKLFMVGPDNDGKSRVGEGSAERAVKAAGAQKARAAQADREFEASMAAINASMSRGYASDGSY